MGREFIDLFEGWAETYDNSVAGLDPEYKDVFDQYDIILDEVAKYASGPVLEFGVGTGNLSQKLMQAGKSVIGIEPSRAMRELATQKLPDLLVMDGDFLDFPTLDIPVESIVSSYAFHHLTDEEKETAVACFAEMLSANGKIIFADTMFKTDAVKEQVIKEAVAKGFMNLAADLNREYYPTIDILQRIFTDHHFAVTCQQMNDFVWLVRAEKEQKRKRPVSGV